MAQGSDNSSAPNDDVVGANKRSFISKRRDPYLVKLVFVNLGILIIGTAFTYYDIMVMMYSILPVLIISSILLWYGRKWRSGIVTLLGSLGFALIIATGLIVWLLDFSPADAQRPVPPMITLFVFPEVILSIVLLVREFRRIR